MRVKDYSTVLVGKDGQTHHKSSQQEYRQQYFYNAAVTVFVRSPQLHCSVGMLDVQWLIRLADVLLYYPSSTPRRTREKECQWQWSYLYNQRRRRCR